MCFIDFSCSAGGSLARMGTGRRMFLLILSRIVCFIDIVWSFVNGFMPYGPIPWNASEEFKAIRGLELGASVARLHDYCPECSLVFLRKRWPAFSDGYLISGKCFLTVFWVFVKGQNPQVFTFIRVDRRPTSREDNISWHDPISRNQESCMALKHSTSGRRERNHRARRNTRCDW